MKFSSTLLTCIFSGLLFASVANGQVLGDYRSVNAPKPGGGNWSDITKWERFDGATWVAAASAPTSADGVITISTNDSIVVNAAVTADQIVVATGAFLNAGIAGNNLTLNNGAGTDLTVDGTFLLRGLNTLSGAGDMTVNGVFNWFSGTLAVVTTTSALSVTNLDLDFVKNLNADFTNNGTFNWSTGGTTGGISFSNAIFTNNGTINELFQSDRGFLNTAGTNGFVNNGTFNKTTLFTFFNANVSFTNSAAGIIKGIGSLSLNGIVTNNGTMSPGSSPGLLNINAGSVSGKNATVQIEVVNGSGAGTGHDVLNLTTSVAFNTDLTTVNLTVTDPGTAPLGSYTILTTTAGSTVSGPFLSENVPSGFIVTYNADNVVVTKLSYPLPAVWGDFSALSKNGQVLLNWVTLQEENTSYFVIEHSENGRVFTPIATVFAKGSGWSSSEYSFIHSDPNKSSMNFYRIRLVDKDNKSSLSATRSVRFSKGTVVLVQATPNPVTTNLQISVQESIVDIRLIDMNGRLLKTLTNLLPGVHTVNVSDLISGQYQLIIYQNNKMIQSQKIIKQ